MTTTKFRLHYLDSLRDFYSLTTSPAPARTMVAEGEIDVPDASDPYKVADVIYDQFQRVGDGHREHPLLFSLRSLSVGDVIELVDDTHSLYLVVDTVGFLPVGAP